MQLRRTPVVWPVQLTAPTVSITSAAFHVQKAVFSMILHSISASLVQGPSALAVSTPLFVHNAPLNTQSIYIIFLKESVCLAHNLFRTA